MPPVLPPHGAAPQRNINPNVKIVKPGNAARGQAGAATAPAARNAIGQPVVAPKNTAGAPSHLPPALQAPGAVPPPIVRGPFVAPGTVSSSAARSNAPSVSIATLGNRGSKGAAVIRPAVAPSGVGGPARPNYGINGTTVQNKH